MSKDKNTRTFGLTNLAIDNATSIFLLTFMILIFGLQAYINMPKEQYPEAVLPTIFVNTPYFGNSAEEIENLITRPIEDEINSVTGVKKVTSSSIQDFSSIIIEFESDVESDLALRRIKDAVDKSKKDLPSDLDDEPDVVEVNFSELPIVTVNISGNYSMDDLREYAEYIQENLENLKEVSKAEMKGALEREVKINVDQIKMEAVQVSFYDIEQAVSSENLTMSGGEITTGNYKRAVRIIGQFEDVGELENIIIKSENQKPVYLKDIAEVEYGFEERTSYARVDGLPVVSLNIIKRQGENLLTTADNIKSQLDIVKRKLPSQLKISLFNDLSVYTRNEVSNLENSIIAGVILVVLILLFFLGLRNAMFVGLSIPLSMLMGIIWLSVFDVTMNIVVLFGLILALGLLVDNAVVVVENIYRYMSDGVDSKTSAKLGTGEVAMPIIASTATTLAAFFPLLLWPGIMGIFYAVLTYHPYHSFVFISIRSIDNQPSTYVQIHGGCIEGG